MLNQMDPLSKVATSIVAIEKQTVLAQEIKVVANRLASLAQTKHPPGPAASPRERPSRDQV
jgi:hypothetical protein